MTAISATSDKVASSDLAQPLPQNQPVFTGDSVALQRRMRFNPLRILDPENLSMALDQFDTGILAPAAVLWDAMARRDDTISFIKPQLEDTIASKPWGVFIKSNADPVEAARHKAALDWFYDHIRATDAFDRNRRGGRHMFIKQMMASASYGYAVHHFVWKPQPGHMIEVEGADPVPALSAEMEFVPLWYFENTTGTLRFLPMGGFGITGKELNWEGEWMVTTGEGIMFAGSICYVFKRLTFQDWTIFNERYSQNKVVGQTNATRDSVPGRAMADLVANFNSDQGIVLYESQPGDKPPISLIGPEGATSVDLFERFLERQDRKVTVMYRGSDLANMSRGKDVTGVSAQTDETERMEMAHCQRIADAAQQGVDRQVIRFCFGEGVEPLAFFGLPDMDAEDAAQVRESAGFLADRGALVDTGEIAERLGITLTETAEDALQGPGAQGPAAPGQSPESPSGDRARKEARLAQLVEDALRTGNGDLPGHEYHGNQWEQEARGTRAIITAIQQHKDAISAMTDPHLGAIDFPYEGRGGKGLKKIVEDHGMDAALHAPHVIAHGSTVSTHGNTTVRVKDGWRVVLTKTEGKDKRHWVLTAYLPEKERGNR